MFNLKTTCIPNTLNRTNPPQALACDSQIGYNTCIVMTHSSTVDKALTLLRSQLPSKVFTQIEGPLRAELSLSSTDELVDSLLALSDVFGSPADSYHDAEDLKAYLVNAALFNTEPNEELVNEIERLTLDGATGKDTSTACKDPLVSALYVACHTNPLKGSPVARLESITQALYETANVLEL